MSNTIRLPYLPWSLAILAGALVACAWGFLYSAEGLNSNTPQLEVVFFGSVAAVPLAIAAVVVELFQARKDVPPRPKRRRAVLWSVSALVVLTALPAAFVAILAATFPRC